MGKTGSRRVGRENGVFIKKCKIVVVQGENILVMMDSFEEKGSGRRMERAAEVK